jgi:hypothetical protein
MQQVRFVAGLCVEQLLFFRLFTGVLTHPQHVVPSPLQISHASYILVPLGMPAQSTQLIELPLHTPVKRIRSTHKRARAKQTTLLTIRHALLQAARKAFSVNTHRNHQRQTCHW